MLYLYQQIFEENSDYPISIELNDSCKLFESGENSYTRFLKERQ